LSGTRRAPWGRLFRQLGGCGPIFLLHGQPRGSLAIERNSSWCVCPAEFRVTTGRCQRRRRIDRAPIPCPFPSPLPNHSSHIPHHVKLPSLLHSHLLLFWVAVFSPGGSGKHDLTYVVQTFVSVGKPVEAEMFCQFINERRACHGDILMTVSYYSTVN
jgi:hypothetical protein